MKHDDHVNLIRNGFSKTNGVWADVGSGEGAFTLAMAELGRSEMTIYSIDKDVTKLKKQSLLMRKQFPNTEVHYIQADFTLPLNLPKLDGIVMANSLHYIKEKEKVMSALLSYLKRNSRIIIVEYNVDTGNYWVPYPLSYNQLFYLSRDLGLAGPQMLNVIPSQFLREIYSALCRKT